jgi:hypothetical protein
MICAPHSLFSIRMTALNPARNIARDYQIDLTCDLFGAYVVDYRWGRIGTLQGRAPLSPAPMMHRICALPDPSPGCARRRIGISYQLASTTWPG